MTRRPCHCRWCVKAAAARSAGLPDAAEAYRSLCEWRHAQRLYTREAAAAALLAELTSLTATSEGDER